MNDQIICPHCNKPIPLTQALSHELKEKLATEQKKELEVEKKRLNEEAIRWREEKQKEIEEKVKEKIELEIKDKKNEIEELRKQNNQLQNQMLDLNKLLRQIRSEREQEKFDFEKKLTQEQEKIREAEKMKYDQEYRLKILEKEKQLNDAIKVNEELKRKLEQGSQQTQGEVLELEIEEIIRREFPYDNVKEVAKGTRGADIIQIVKNQYGKECGTIIWELKRTKAWSNEWIKKLKDDQRSVNAELAVLVSGILPDGIKHFGTIEEVWICSFDAILGLITLLRESLIKIYGVKSLVSGKEEKKEILWNYLTGVEFNQRIGAILDAYSQLQEDVEKEKRWFTQKWAKQEKNIRKVIDNILGMSGDLQSIIGKSLPEIKGLDMLSSGKKDKKDKEIIEDEINKTLF
ncbi:MAG: hypothetical protein UR15_C0018G0002 [Parcubacteria group bacterium GW2011_GWA2_31_28]|nr:MAG: hypothetical protein UR15_C0018G0002 [Parcubacteria group bacterium GW2011_GWA2_31_28]